MLILSNRKIICQNKKAHHEYFIEDIYQCGIVLQGTEIKSIRKGSCNIKDSYIVIKNGEAFILNMHISKYEQGNLFNHDEDRSRELLLHKHETIKLATKVKLEGLAINGGIIVAIFEEKRVMYNGMGFYLC